MDITKKYAPKFFNELVGHSYIIDYFKKLIKSPQKFPKNYILYGDYGIGKTSITNCFVDEFGKSKKVIKKFYNINVFNKVDVFSEISQHVNNIYKFSSDIYILIFDEFHRARSEAQQTLLNVLEDEKIENVYFIFTTTDINKVLETVRSRCIELYLKKLSDEEIKKSLNNIIEIENIKLNNDVLDIIIRKSDGHLRDAYYFLNLYNVFQDNFKNIITDTYILIKDFLINKKDNIQEIKLYSVNILLGDLDKLIEEYSYNNLNNLIKVIRLLEMYSKFKNEITTIDHFVAVLLVLRKVIGG